MRGRARQSRSSRRTGSVAAAIAAICRHLDGIPLAIELAAARTNALGVEELAARLDDCFHLLTGGRRTALPRHQTLRATLDWSYRLLPEPERVVLRRLAIFAGGFTLQAASTIAATDEIAGSDIVDCAANLVAKSLVAADLGGATGWYRLLETTRAYAFEKLSQSGEFEQLARRHAEYCRDLFERAEVELQTRPASEWLAAYGRRIDNLRTALDWAFSPGGDASIGVALTAAAVPLWVHLSLMEECRSRVEQALSALTPRAGRDPRCEMKLQAALGASQVHTGAVTVPEIEAAWTRALEIAESLDDAEYQLRSLLGLWFFQTVSGRHRAALALAQSFCALAAKLSDPNDPLIGERMIGVSQYYLGDHSSARRRLEHMLAHYDPVAEKSHIIRFQSDQQVTARVVLARILWLQGFADQSMRAAESSVADARAANHTNSLCYALSQAACPIALSVGDLAAAEHYVMMLVDHSTRRALTLWQAWGRSYQGVLVIKRGDSATGLRLLRAGLDELREAKFAALRLVTFLMAEALARAGQIADGLAMIEEAIARSEHTEERWLIAELLRVKGELLLLQDAPEAATAAEGHFRQALDWARRQGALSWELRAATSLARLLRDHDRSTEAIALVAPIYNRFTEGFETDDLKAAKALIDGFHNSRGDAAGTVRRRLAWWRHECGRHGAACSVPPTSKAHSAKGLLGRCNCRAGRSWVSTESPRWTTAAMMAPTIGAKPYNQASPRLPVTIIGPSARAGLKAAPVSAPPMRMLKTKVRPIATGARWAARPATAVLSTTVTRKKASTASTMKPIAGVIVTGAPPRTRPCASSGVPRPVATPPSTIRNNSAAATPPAIWLTM